MGTTLVLSVGIGVLLGLMAAVWVRSWKDHVISVVAIIAYAMPLFWIGLMLILLFAIKLDWLPTSGMEDAAAFYEGWERVVDIAQHLILPAVTLSLFYMALYARLMRATMLEQRGLDYVTTARAKGLTERQITLRHVVRNALMPVVTVAGVQVGGLLGGSVVVESVFAWPGLGQLAFQSLFARDLNLLLGIFFISSCLVVVINIVVDVVYVLLDPRRQGRLMQSFWRRFFGNPRVALGLVWLAFIVAVAAGAPVLAPGSPFAIVCQAVLAAVRRIPVRHRLARPQPTGRAHPWRAHLAADCDTRDAGSGRLRQRCVGAIAGFYGRHRRRSC